MPDRGGRRRYLTVALALIAFVIAVPLADTAAFGLHDHVVDGSRDVTALHAGHAHATTPGAHHCDLAMNPAHSGSGATMFPPGTVAPSPPPENVGHTAGQPFVPFAPPRA